jgi:hypothetical protein
MKKLFLSEHFNPNRKVKIKGRMNKPSLFEHFSPGRKVKLKGRMKNLEH